MLLNSKKFKQISFFLANRREVNSLEEGAKLYGGATLLNGKILNLLDEMNHIEHVEAFRLNFTIESKEETIKILQIAKEKLAGSNRSVFNQNTDTRGHFNKEIA